MPDEAPMRFFVEETSFKLPDDFEDDDIEERLDELVGLLGACRQKGLEIYCWSALLDTELRADLKLSGLLYAPGGPITIDREVRAAIIAALNRCVHWDSRVDPAPNPDVTIADAPAIAPTAAVVLQLNAEKRGAACLCLRARADRVGVLLIAEGERRGRVHFTCHERELAGFFRSVIELEDLEAVDYMSNASHAFPEVAFVPGLASQFSRFSTRYREVRPVVTEHLAALNDHFQRLLKSNKGEPDVTMKELRSLCGVDASPESPKTRANRSAMRERDVNVNSVVVGGRDLKVGRVVRCEWHTKIKPTTDRIHFSPGEKDVAEGRLIVGMFKDHLST